GCSNPNRRCRASLAILSPDARERTVCEIVRITTCERETNGLYRKKRADPRRGQRPLHRLGHRQTDYGRRRHVRIYPPAGPARRRAAEKSAASVAIDRPVRASGVLVADGLSG